MATEVDLTVGINLTIGSIPVALQAEIDTSPDKTVYTFDGSVQDADIPLGDFLSFVGQQFGVAVLLPPELNLDARIDYVAGQLIQTSPTSGAKTTELSIAGKFDLSIEGHHLTLMFFADTILNSPAPATGNPYAVGAAIDTSLAFKDLPLVGDVPGFNQLTLTHIGFSYTNAKTGQVFSIPQVVTRDNPLYTGHDPDARNRNIYTVAPADASKTFKLDGQGFALTAGLTNAATGAVQQNFALPMTLPANTTPARPSPYLPAKTTPPSTSVHWISINKQIGPVNLQQIGLNYSQGEATFGFSAGFTLGPFTLELEGLSITFPLPLPGTPAGTTTSFDLQGLGFDFSTGSITASGAFLKVKQDDVTSYFGEIAVQVATFGLKALGGYTPAYTDSKGKKYPASFFLYAAVEVPLGGPPFLFVTGLAGGFGVNRTLILPTIDTLSGYILLPSNAPAQAATPSATIAAILPQLEAVFLDQPGEYWVAAGLSFTSFEMIDAFALVTVSFGVDFQVALLGSCSMTLPTGDPDPIAYIEIDLIASYSPASGLLAVAGKLSPASYLYGGFCHLFGGFAFYTWFSGDHRGDFVVSVGGYSPYFTKPPHYPDVARLGMSFGLGALQVIGQSYFALTPAMMMAGMSLTASWSSGPISASFGVGIDVLLAWSPFHYQARAYVAIAVSANIGLLTINVHVGADLTIWGPAFGGRADVDLDVISFTITFGASPAAPPPVGWATFASNFLPQSTTSKPTIAGSRRKGRRLPHGVTERIGTRPAAAAGAATNVIGASVTRGLQQSEVSGVDWIIDPDAFAILTNSTIPANRANWVTGAGNFVIPNDVSKYNPPSVDVSSGPYLSLPPVPPPFSKTQVWNPVLNIAPMNQTNVQSFHTVQIQKQEENGSWTDITAVSVQPVWLASNAALWAAPKEQKTANDPALVPNALTGFAISPIPRHPDVVKAVPLEELLFAQGYNTGFRFDSQAVDGRYHVSSSVDSAGTLTIQVTGAHVGTLVNHGYVLSSLLDPWVTSQRESMLQAISDAGFATYTGAQVDLSVFAAQTALVDWPAAELLGEALS